MTESLEALRAERPDDFAALAALLAGRAIALDVDGERFAVAFSAGEAAIADTAEAPAVRLRMSRRLIADVVRAETTLVDAAREDRLEVIGGVAEIALVYDGLMLYVHGAIRAPSFPGLWERFRRLLPPGAEETRWTDETP